MELTMFLLVLLSVLLILYLLWFLGFADTDFSLALAEKYGHPISVYRQKVVWVTGASAGLGEAMAYELASVGAKLVLTARNKERLEQVKNKCLELAKGQLNDRDILVLPFDITDGVDVHQGKVDDALNHFGQIHLLVNNAGRFQCGRTLVTDLEVDKDMFEVNFFGTIKLTKLLLRHFLDRANGQILVVSSGNGKIGSPGVASYAATKHALHGYFESIRMEHYKDNIHVTIACPSFFDSDMAVRCMSMKKGEVLSAVRCPIEMKTSRCAYLVLAAAANHLHEVWIAYQPFLFWMYMAQYLPGVFRVLLKIFFTKDQVNEMCQGRFPDNILVWKPLFQ